MFLNPTVYDADNRGNNLFSLNLENRNILLTGEINDELAASIVTQLLYLDSVGSEPITMYINSPGGSVSAGLGIYDTMKSLDSKVVTVCIGQAASMGAVLLSGGEPGMRYILPHSQVMVHQPSGGIGGQASDILIVASHIETLRNTLNEILAENCNQSTSEVAKSTDRDYWMNAAEAVQFGIVDKIFTGKDNKKR